MATVFHSLSDVELLRAARTSPLMDAPLFAELADRFEVEVEGETLRELAHQQRTPRPLTNSVQEPQSELAWTQR